MKIIYWIGTGFYFLMERALGSGFVSFGFGVFMKLLVPPNFQFSLRLEIVERFY